MMQYNRTAAATAWDWVGGTRDTVWQSPWTSLGVLDSMISVCLCVCVCMCVTYCPILAHYVQTQWQQLACPDTHLIENKITKQQSRTHTDILISWNQVHLVKSRGIVIQCLLSLQPNPMLLLLLSCCIASCGTLEYNNNRTSVGLGWRDKDTAARQPSIMTQVLIWCSDLKSSICVQNHSLSIRW